MEREIDQFLRWRFIDSVRVLLFFTFSAGIKMCEHGNFNKAYKLNLRRKLKK